VNLWPALVSVLSAIAAFAVLCRLLPDKNRLMMFVAVGTLFGVGFVVWLIAARTPVDVILANLVVFAFMCELYIFLFSSVETSISASVLLALASGQRTAAEIERLCSDTSMIDSRLQRFLKTGLLRAQSGRYLLTPRARLLLGVARRLRRFFGYPQFEAGAVVSSRQRD
jgi:hypothetical protein